MLPHSGLVISFMVLLALAGIYKLADPSSTSGALRVAGLPSSPHLVRLLGAVEIGVGVTGVAWGGPLSSGLAALLYAGFLVFVAEALRRRLPISSCGCLGAAETPPTISHVIVNSVAIITLTFGAIFPIGALGGTLDAPPGEAGAFLLFTAVAVYLLYGVISVLPLRRSLARSTPVGIRPQRTTP